MFNYYFILFTLCVIFKEIESQNVNASLKYIPSKSCIQNCSGKEDFSRCSYNCFSNWPFSYTERCHDDFYANPLANVPCSPIRIRTSVVVSYFGNRVNLYPQITWLPCQTALEYVQGYWINIYSESSPGAAPCYLLHLRENITLNNTDRQTQMMYVLPYPLRYNSHYVIEIGGYPYLSSSDEYQDIRLVTHGCHVYQEKNSCFCGLSRNSISPPKIEIIGYKVKVSSFAAPSCFQIYHYDFRICSDEYCSKVLFMKSLRVDYQNRTMISQVFDHIYDSSKPIWAEITMVSLKHSPQISNLSHFIAKAWKPPPPDVKILSQESVRISFPFPSPFNFTRCYIRLSRIKVENDSMLENITVETKNIPIIMKELNQLVWFDFVGLEEGMYAVQLREVRNNGKYFNPSYWGPTTTFNLPTYTDIDWSVLLPMVIAVVVLTIVVVSVSIFLYLWKKGNCQPFRKVLPSRFVDLLDKQTVAWSRKTVLIVWQADFRNPELQESYTKLISHLSAFLHSVCSFNVILDLYEEIELARSVGDWVQKSFEKANVIIFVCPHFNYIEEVTNLCPIIGNFSRMYSFAESDLGNKAKFATVLLPFSDTSSTSATLYLKKMTAVFSLMDQIEDLYFYVQGISKFDCWARHSAENISGRDYTKTVSGLSLMRVINEFQATLNSFTPSSSRFGSKNSEHECMNSEENDPLMNDHISQKEENKVIISPVLIHSLENIEGPSSAGLPEKSRSPVVPIVPFVSNPEEELKKINRNVETQQKEDKSDEYCPYHTSNVNALSSCAVGTASPSLLGDESSYSSIHITSGSETCSQTAKDSGYDSAKV